jgi:hypothetical protein
MKRHTTQPGPRLVTSVSAEDAAERESLHRRRRADLPEAAAAV